MQYSSHSIMIKRLLIANRGEISCRITRTAKLLGIESVAIYSEQDRNALHVKQSDEAYFVGPSPPTQSYLNQDKIIQLAKEHNVSAIHPGYGFLSENFAFVQKCEENGIIFVGPPSKAIHDMGIKSISKQLMTKAAVPIIPGYFGENQSDTFLLQEARNIGYPVMLKADYGGGGKGIRICFDESEFLQNLDRARNEAQKAFGNEKIMVEKFIEDPKHIEVQIFGDKHGNYVTLFERDCSIQRRHQKVIEETPANFLDPAIRENLYSMAIKAAFTVNYVGAGTVEFIMDKGGKFYFMEMNTRLQVEHGITEMVTGLDLVEWQLRVASGETLPLKQEAIKCEGHAIEARICAEDTDNNFIPSPGKIDVFIFDPKERAGIRLDSGVEQGDEISIYYDSMIAKVMAWAPERTVATQRLKNAINSLYVIGPKTNLSLVSNILSEPSFEQPSKLHTNYIKTIPTLFEPPSTSDEVYAQMAVAKALNEAYEGGTSPKNDPFSKYKWYRINNYYTEDMTIKIKSTDTNVGLTIMEKDKFRIKVSEKDKYVIAKFKGESLPKSIMWDDGTGIKDINFISYRNNYLLKHNGIVYDFMIKDKYSEKEKKQTKSENFYLSPINGTVEKIMVKKGDDIKKDQSLVVILAMKMEYIIKSSRDGIVDEIRCREGENIQKNKILITLK